MTRSIVSSLVVVVMCAFTSPAWAAETFGVESFASSIVSAEGAGGRGPDLQAGSHPYAVTTAIVFNHVVTEVKEGQPPRAVRTAIQRTSK